ncbi:L,D-transpeptidase catalytic domain [Rhodospirillales bacterium URHD0017]|nr:L,D-transpeptidase catalytic domain [Rhodospirillales bacterium URHD0017]
MGPSVRPIRAILRLLSVASALAACATTEQRVPPAIGPAVRPETPLSGYVSMLRSQGVGVDIPSQGKFVLVNIPSFELVALQDGVPVLRSRVVVGKPAAATPEMLSSMFAVQFNPSWTPTPSMIRNEGLHYMPPGPQNPLGRMMFALDNEEFIYLHDTNEKALFNRGRRALSHGCVRVEQARALAAWSLGVSEREIDSMITQGKTYSVPLPEIIPVALVYFTRFPDEHGQVVLHPDIYNNRQVEQRGNLKDAAS